MRTICLGLALLAAQLVAAQAGWLPVSREVERPYSAELSWPKHMAHTAIRPYRAKEIRAIDHGDSLRPVGVLAALDRWSGARNSRV